MATEKPQAVGDHVIVLQPAAGSKTRGGIVLPERSRVPFFYGRVLSTGADVKEVQLNEVVFYEPSAARVLTMSQADDAPLLALPEACIYLRVSIEWAERAGFSVPMGSIDECLKLSKILSV